ALKGNISTAVSDENFLKLAVLMKVIGDKAFTSFTSLLSMTDELFERIDLHKGLVSLKLRDPSAIKIFADLRDRAKSNDAKEFYNTLVIASVMTLQPSPQDVDCILGKAIKTGGTPGTGPVSEKGAKAR
ncbi:MAG: hypothetical protein C0179_07130, partial [Fervidicoccus sp.]